MNKLFKNIFKVAVLFMYILGVLSAIFYIWLMNFTYLKRPIIEFKRAFIGKLKEMLTHPLKALKLPKRTRKRRLICPYCHRKLAYMEHFTKNGCIFCDYKF